MTDLTPDQETDLFTHSPNQGDAKTDDEATAAILGEENLSFLSLSEIEQKLPSFFEGIKAAHALLEGLKSADRSCTS
jgi:hypothetical protein